MATATVNWIAGGGGGTQTLQMRRSDGAWADVVTNIPAGTTTAQVSNLDPNWIYEFRVVNNCSGGVPTTSAPARQMLLTCPSVSLSNTSNSVSYSFTHLGGDVTRYVVTLFAADGVTPIDNRTHASPSGTLSGTFSVAAGTYHVGVRVDGASDYAFQNTCAPQSITVAATSCTAPTSVTASITPDNANLS